MKQAVPFPVNFWCCIRPFDFLSRGQYSGLCVCGGAFSPKGLQWISSPRGRLRPTDAAVSLAPQCLGGTLLPLPWQEPSRETDVATRSLVKTELQPMRQSLCLFPLQSSSGLILFHPGHAGGLLDPASPVPFSLIKMPLPKLTLTLLWREKRNAFIVASMLQ